MFAWLGSIFAGPVVKAVFDLLADYISHIWEIFEINKAKGRQNDAAKAIEDGDNESLEKIIGDSDAGKPSGRGETRPRRLKK